MHENGLKARQPRRFGRTVAAPLQSFTIGSLQRLQRPAVIETGQGRRSSKDEKLRIVLESLQVPRRVFGGRDATKTGQADLGILGAGRRVVVLDRGRCIVIRAGVDTAALTQVLDIWNGDDPVSSATQVWINTGIADMRCGMKGLALLEQEGLGDEPVLAIYQYSAGGAAI